MALVRAVFEKELTLLKRYWFNTVGGLAANYILFVFMFFGGQAVAPTVFENNLTGIIVGWFVWAMSWSSFQESAQTLTREATWGTLEQTYMTPIGIFPIMTARIIVGLAFTVTTGLIMLILMMATTGHWVLFDPFTVLPIAFVTMASATGLGFAFGGLALIYKQISSIFLIVQFLLLGAIGSPDLAITKVLPLSWGTTLLTYAMEENVSLWQLPIFDLLGVVAVSTGYIGIGYAAFGYAVRVAKRRGIMGHY
ncbi:ABC transporter permease [Natrinema salsiterrestre]|uniref:ABC transporter permease n=1 Tax=Natrinema salsiterrestre TaxID=2950540 RepID=A0A9Q4Q3E7_9EURY|nr:ABC transporter permease [Natrinema salsiterrestre]MDF9747481.1 ABC transporter permease [Natrinema salsiterrestre]